MFRIKHAALMVVLVSAMLVGCAGMTLAPHTPYYDLKSECRSKHAKIHPMIEALQRKHRGAFHVSSSGTYNVNVQVSSYKVGNTTYYNSSSNVTKIPNSVSGSTVHFWKKDNGRIRAVEVYTDEPFNQQETFINSACVSIVEYEEIVNYRSVGKSIVN